MGERAPAGAGGGGGAGGGTGGGGPVLKRGPLRKLKGMKKKYFVLRGDDEANSARLEYYDSEKKWRSGAAPKRAIAVKSCFNIQRRLDTKHKHALALYTSEDCLCVVLDSEEEVAAWLGPLLSLLHGEPQGDHPPADPAQLPRQHVWQVNVQKKGLGASRNILGLYNLCLTDRVLSLVKIRPDTNVHISDELQFPLVCIRRCGDSECFFYMEVGRSAITGAGELWMHTEDPNIALSMHATILNAMSSKPTSTSTTTTPSVATAVPKDELGPKSRNRSSSANEASKPISVLTRRQTHAGSKSHGLSPSENTFCGGRSCVGLCISPCVTASAAYSVSQETDLPLNEGSNYRLDDYDNNVDVNNAGSAGSVSGVRERCDSLPSRANATASSTPRVNITPYIGTQRMTNSHRPHSMFVHTVSQSPPVVINSPLSPNSGACSTDSAGSSMSIDETDSFSHHMLSDENSHHMMGRFANSLTPKDQTIPEEGADETLSVWQPSKSLIDAVDGNSPVPIGSPKDEYIPMSPGSIEPFKIAHSTNHSRTSSLAENTNADSILHNSMGKTEDGYVDMEPAKKDHSHTMSPAGSVCSVTSGTPSTDIRFSEFHLEKVPSYFTHSEDDENRPARAYSVGSRPDHLKKIFSRPEPMHVGIGVIDPSRTRAFSVGSHYKHKDNRILNHGTPPHHQLHHLHDNTHPGNKSLSAPLLAGNSQTNTPSRQYGNSSYEPDDLMEMDFTNHTSSLSKSSMKNLDTIQHSTSVQSSLCSPNISIVHKATTDGYLDMSPVNNLGYVPMKPVEPNTSGCSTPKTFSSVMRKASITKSPPVTNSQQTVNQPPTPEGYLEMSWNSTKSQIRSRVSSLPIAISTDCKNENVGSISAVSSSASPVFSSISKFEEDNKKSISRGSSDSISGLRKRSIKLQIRRNSKELMNQSDNMLHAMPLTLNINNPVSSMKSNSSKSKIDPDDVTERKCSIDASSGTLKLLGMAQMLKQCSLTESENESNLEYMEMNPSRLTTVKEMSEVASHKIGVDKDMKQFINNATKVFDSNSQDFSEYISLNPNATIDNKNIWFARQKSTDDPSSNSVFSDQKENNSLPISAPKSSVFKKIPAFPILTFGKSSDVDIRENRSMLSSNPMANKTIMPKPNTNILNLNLVQNVKKPILVKITGQTHPNTASFKPIPTNEMNEVRSVKPGSPKPVESVLNRQLSANVNELRISKNECYDITSQNGQTQEKQTSRPGSVNNKSKKGNGCSGSRPPSVASQGDVNLGNINRSRPSSVSSEISNTPTNSRPASVMSERESGSRGLHYASLELDSNPDRSPRPPPTPVSSQSAFSYAQIDFIKSEELKNSKNLSTKSKN